MKKMRTIFIILAALVALLAPAALAAEGDERPGGMPGAGPGAGYEGRPDGAGPGMRGPGEPPSEERMEQIRKRIEMVKMWKLTEVLELDEKTAAKLFPLLSRYDKERMEIQKELFELRRQERQEQGTRGKDRDYGNILKKVEKIRKRMHELEEEQLAELKKILTPEQVLKYMVFEERFRQEMQQMMRESRGGGDRGPGPGGPGAGGPGMGGPGAGGSDMRGPGGPGMRGPGSGGPGSGGMVRPGY